MSIVTSPRRWPSRRGARISGIVVLALWHIATASAAALVQPPAFASVNGTLDILMTAMPQPVSTILFSPPDGLGGIHPTAWVYQICRRVFAIGDKCPPGLATASNYGGVQLALQPGDLLKIRLVNALPALNPIKLANTGGNPNFALNPTNLHTHGLLVPARPPTLSDPTFGDYVFVDVYNPANGMPTPQSTHQDGSIVVGPIDYRIDIPKDHPSGLFWFHPHLHGISVNQVSSGLAGIITVGNIGDYVRGGAGGAPFQESQARYLVLQDMQVLAAGTLQFDQGAATVANGEVLNQQDPTFCNQYPATPSEVRDGSCPGTNNAGGNNYTGGQWYFTVNGQQFPTISVTEAGGQIWRVTNASASLTYDLQLVDNTTQQPILMQLVAVDGVSINVPPATSPAALTQFGGARFKTTSCPQAAATGSATMPVCVRQFAMMPSSRVELLVAYRDASGNIAPPPSGATATFQQVGITTGPVGDSWPAVSLAQVQFAPLGKNVALSPAAQVTGGALNAPTPAGILAHAVPGAAPAALPASCAALAAGHHRRIFFSDTIQIIKPTGVWGGIPLGLGYEEVDQNGAVVSGTQVPVTAFDPTVTTICLPLGPGQTPVHETWELVNLATENHNFHVHQAHFRQVLTSSPPQPVAFPPPPVATPPGSTIATEGPAEDNIPLPVAVPGNINIAVQAGYCTITQWHNGQCTSPPVVVDIAFTQVGTFVYHCHILAHEDFGMMAKIQVVSSPN